MDLRGSFFIIFVETGLVVLPFLPGDSLLFAAGSIAAIPTLGAADANMNASEGESMLSISALFLLLTFAAILGNKINYFIGRNIGPRVFNSNTSWWLNKKHLITAHQFYERHGGKTIIISRFLPIIRTFVPFIAGVSTMRLRDFALYNVASALLWVSTLLFSGYFFGQLPFVKAHFSLMLYAIIAASILLPWILIFLKKSHK